MLRLDDPHPICSTDGFHPRSGNFPRRLAFADRALSDSRILEPFFIKIQDFRSAIAPLDRGVVAIDPIGALAHLQLGRAFALSGDKTKAKTAYRDFLTHQKPCTGCVDSARFRFVNKKTHQRGQIRADNGSEPPPMPGIG